MTRLEQSARRQAILALWADCWPARKIADDHKCSESNVHRIVREYGDAVTTRTERGVEMKRAEFNRAAIIAAWREGKAVEEIAKSLGLLPREVRAAVYTAIKSGEAGGAYASQKSSQP